jgi:hypothetical protein
MSWTIPNNFSGAKFSTRYSLQAIGPQPDFWVISGELFMREGIVLPDDPPIFEPPDPPRPSVRERLDLVRSLPELIELLKAEWK